MRRALILDYDFIIDFTALNAHDYSEALHYKDLRDQFNAIRSRYKKRHSSKKKDTSLDENQIKENEEASL